MISSPDLSIDMNAFSPQQTQSAAQTANQQLASQAAAVAALQSLMPSMNPLMSQANFSLTDPSQLAQLAAAAQSQVSPSTQALNNLIYTSSTPTPTMQSQSRNSSTPANSNNNGGHNQARSRLMFDPLSELPILERWFEENPHPGWLQIEQYTESLNNLQYRQNYPPISTHNVKIWFKNRRAKCKRLLTAGNDSNPMSLGNAADAIASQYSEVKPVF